MNSLTGTPRSQATRTRTSKTGRKPALTQQDVEAKALFLRIFDIAREPGTPLLFEVHHSRRWPLLQDGELDRDRYDHRSDRLIGVRCWPWILGIDWDAIEHDLFRNYVDYHGWHYDEYETSPGHRAGLINPRSKDEKEFIEETVQRMWPAAYIRNELNGLSLPGTPYKLDKHRWTAEVDTGETTVEMEYIGGGMFGPCERPVMEKQRRVHYDNSLQRSVYRSRGGNVEWLRERLRWFEAVERWPDDEANLYLYLRNQSIAHQRAVETGVPQEFEIPGGWRPESGLPPPAWLRRWADEQLAARGEPIAPAAPPEVADDAELPAYVLDVMNRKAGTLLGRKRSGPTDASKLAWHAVNLALRAGCSEDRIVSLWRTGVSALWYYRTEKQVRQDYQRAVKKFGHHSARWRDQDAKYDAIAYASVDPRLASSKYAYRIVVELACFHPELGDPGPGLRWLRDAVGAGSIGTISELINNLLMPLGYVAKTGKIVNPRVRKTAQAQTFKVQSPHTLPQLPENTTIEHLRDAGWGIIKSVCELRERELPRWGVRVDDEQLVQMVKRLGSVDALYDEVDEDDLAILIEEEKKRAKARKAEGLLHYLGLQGEYQNQRVRKLEQKLVDLGFGQAWKRAA